MLKPMASGDIVDVARRQLRRIDPEAQRIVLAHRVEIGGGGRGIGHLQGRRKCRARCPAFRSSSSAGPRAPSSHVILLAWRGGRPMSLEPACGRRHGRAWPKSRRAAGRHRAGGPPAVTGSPSSTSAMSMPCACQHSRQAAHRGPTRCRAVWTRIRHEPDLFLRGCNQVKSEIVKIAGRERRGS